MNSFDAKDDAETRREKLRVDSQMASWPGHGLSGGMSILAGGAIVAAAVAIAALTGVVP